MPVNTNEESVTAPKLWTSSMIVLVAASFLAYANISVFFRFCLYLQTLPIDPLRYGLLIGIYSAASLVARPVISPWIGENNARVCLFIGVIMGMLSLSLYGAAAGFWSMLAVRCLHGLSFVLMGSALMTLIVGRVPKGRSSEAFGYVAVIVMLPNTVVPPLWPYLDAWFGGFTNVLLGFAGLTFLIIPLMLFSGRGETVQTQQESPRLSRSEIKTNLTDGKILGIFAAMLFLYCGTALVFFFVADMAQKAGLIGVGAFFTITTLGEISVRVAAGKKFDRFPKAYLVSGTMAVLAVSYALLGRVEDRTLFYVLAVFLGLGWGAAMPVLNGLTFDVSLPKFRALNINLSTQMFQAGFFVGPFLGGWILHFAGFRELYYFAALLSLAGAVIMYCSGRRKHGMI